MSNGLRRIQVIVKWILLLTTLVVALTGCGGEAKKSPVPPVSPVGADYHVDAINGSNTNNGLTAATAFKTITQALNTVNALGLAGYFGKVILVHPGTYDAPLGEVFPLTVPDGVELIGNETSKGLGTLIRHTDITQHGIELLSQAVLAGLEIRAEDKSVQYSGLAAVHVANTEGNTMIRNNTVDGTTLGQSWFDGIAVEGINDNVFGNTIKGMAWGLVLGGGLGGSGTVVQDNRIIGNEYALGRNFGSVSDMGGGGKSTGGNVFSCSQQLDVVIYGGGPDALQNNYWDNATPTSVNGTTGTGQDIGLQFSPTPPNTTGAQSVSALGLTPCIP